MPAQEFLVAALAELAPAPCLHPIEAGGIKLLLVRLPAGLHAVDALCPHAQAPLAEGALCGKRLVCPWHHSVFDVSDGALVDPPALDGLHTYPVRVEAGNVFVTRPERLEEPRRVPHPPASVPGHGRTVAVVGAGAAGQAAVEALRSEGFAGRVVMIGREKFPPYDRTNLSKHFLTGDAGEDKLPLRPDGFLDGLHVERLTKTVTVLNAPEKTIHFEDGSALPYDGALLAAGSVPKTLAVPGADLPNVWTLRTLEDARRLVGAVGGGKRVVVIGASFIGLEVVSSLRQRGVDVAVVSPVKVPFERQLGREVGESLRRLHEQNGVRFHLTEEVARLAGDASGVREVQLKSGGVVSADIVVVGIGVRPATDFVHGVGLAEDGGAVVDEHLHAGHGLYAAGDLANFPLTNRSGGTGRARIEHWRVAQQHARLAARNLAAGKPQFTLADEGFVPFFWTFHFGQRLNYVGHASEGGEVILDGDPCRPPFLAYYLRDGAVVAAAGTHRDADLAALHELLRLGKAPTAEQLRRGKFSPRHAVAEISAVR